jgi:hypothetical protein
MNSDKVDFTAETAPGVFTGTIHDEECEIGIRLTYPPIMRELEVLAKVVRTLQDHMFVIEEPEEDFCWKGDSRPRGANSRRLC